MLSADHHLHIDRFLFGPGHRESKMWRVDLYNLAKICDGCGILVWFNCILDIIWWFPKYSFTLSLKHGMEVLSFQHGRTLKLLDFGHPAASAERTWKNCWFRSMPNSLVLDALRDGSRMETPRRNCQLFFFWDHLTNLDITLQVGDIFYQFLGSHLQWSVCIPRYGFEFAPCLTLIWDQCRQELDLNRAQWTVNDYWGSVGRDVGVGIRSCTLEILFPDKMKSRGSSRIVKQFLSMQCKSTTWDRWAPCASLNRCTASLPIRSCFLGTSYHRSTFHIPQFVGRTYCTLDALITGQQYIQVNVVIDLSYCVISFSLQWVWAIWCQNYAGW